MPKTFNQQMQDIFSAYLVEVGEGAPVDLNTVGRWAIREGLWKPQPRDMLANFRAQMSKALREEYRTDAKGRRYRAKHAVREKRDGKQLTLWADIDNAPRSHMVKAFGQRRTQIVGDCFQLHQDVAHYNDVNQKEEPIQLEFDFTEDVAERLWEMNSVDAEAA